MFSKDPTKYAPQFGGFCANGIIYGIPWRGDPDTWKMNDGGTIFLAASLRENTS